MSTFRIITHEWNSYEDTDVEVGETTARVSIFVDNRCLTTNHDLFSRTIRDQIHVSLYPLALWFASSWWRLHNEILPDSARKSPSHDWRMSHEMTAANMGFLWPQIMFSADGDNIQVWAQASQGHKDEAVKYLNGLEYAHSISKTEFTQEVSSLINDVIARLYDVDCRETDLTTIWSFIQEDLKNPSELKKRRLEAMLGFDPESCSEALIAEAIGLEKELGPQSFSELVGAYASDESNRLNSIRKLIQTDGVEGAPDDVLQFTDEVGDSTREPWEIAVSAARELRRKLGNTREALTSSTLNELLGLPTNILRDWLPTGRTKAAVAGPGKNGKMKFIPRRWHPVAQRFELARLIGDYVRSSHDTSETWLVSADLSTSRQKFQRAFAAELLCPINSLVDFLGGDFSELALEDAANHFSVSDRTVEALLMNNGYLPKSPFNYGMPYIVGN